MRRFRVECNFGCRYFQDEYKALSYYKKCLCKHLDVELWVVHYVYYSDNNTFSATQKLLAFSGTHLPKY